MKFYKIICATKQLVSKLHYSQQMWILSSKNISDYMYTVEQFGDGKMFLKGVSYARAKVAFIFF